MANRFEVWRTNDNAATAYWRHERDCERCGAEPGCDEGGSLLSVWREAGERARELGKARPYAECALISDGVYVIRFTTVPGHLAIVIVSITGAAYTVQVTGDRNGIVECVEEALRIVEEQI